MNLPRAIRFKRENIIIVGLLPGPKEPSKSINVRNIALMTHILYCVHNHALLIGYVTLYHLLVTHVILSLYRVRALLFLVLCVLIIISHI